MVGTRINIEPTSTLSQFARDYSRQGEGDGVTRDDELIGEVGLSDTMEFITNPTKLLGALLL
jgi:hypothetical protein